MKGYFSIVVSLMCFFMLGAYTDATFKYCEEIEIHRWALTGFFAISFLVLGIAELKDNK